MKRWATLLASTVVALGLAEGLLALTDGDLRLLQPSLYKTECGVDYGDGSTGVYRHSDDPRKIYELDPGDRAECFTCDHPLDSTQTSTIMHINSYGTRGPEPRIGEHLCRIVILGGSNTFGCTVSDPDTYPYQLQLALDRRSPGHFDVINAGLNAYTLSQKVVFAEELLETLHPDLLVFQHYNVSRRAFLCNDASYGDHFHQNPELYLENIPCLWTESERVGAIHRHLVTRSHLYRALATVFNRFAIWLLDRAAGTGWETGLRWKDTAGYRMNLYGNEVNEREMRRFLDENPKIPILYLSPPEHGVQERLARHAQRNNVWYLALEAEGMPPEYSEIHPPSYVYEWYAAELVRFLEEEMEPMLAGGCPRDLGPVHQR